MLVHVKSHLEVNNFLFAQVPISTKGIDLIYIKNYDDITPFSIRRNCKELLELTFDDIDCPLEPYIMPTKQHVREALEFSKDSRNLVVSCASGRTRSVAIAYVCLCVRTSPQDARRLFDYDKHPNRAIIKYASEILNNEEIYNVYNKWKNP